MQEAPEAGAHVLHCVIKGYQVGLSRCLPGSWYGVCHAYAAQISSPFLTPETGIIAALQHHTVETVAVHATISNSRRLDTHAAVHPEPRSLHHTSCRVTEDMLRYIG